MDKIEVEMEAAKETKGTYVYENSESPYCTSIYLKKYTFSGNGGRPNKIKITIETIED